MPSPFGWSLAGNPGGAGAAAVAATLSTSLYGLTLTTVALHDDIIGIDIPVGDLALDDAGQLVWTEGAEQARQEIECRLSFFLGEYFLDTRQGVPYFRDVLRKNPDKDAVRSVFKRTIKSVPGVVAVSEMSYDLDNETRKLTLDWEAFWIDGTPLRTPDDFQLILGPAT